MKKTTMKWIFLNVFQFFVLRIKWMIANKVEEKFVIRKVKIEARSWATREKIELYMFKGT